MRCEEVMKRHVERLHPDDTLLAAAQKMREHDVGFLPVCEEDGRVVGVITDRDIVVRACANDVRMTEVRVGAIMTTDVVSCRASHGIRHVEALMIKYRKLRVVVTDPFGVLLGVISLSDVAQYEAPSHTATTLYGVTARKYDPSTGLG
jgi:CBS domain-containing protein